MQLSTPLLLSLILLIHFNDFGSPWISSRNIEYQANGLPHHQRAFQRNSLEPLSGVKSSQTIDELSGFGSGFGVIQQVSNGDDTEIGLPLVEQQQAVSEYAVVVDCGSSGSRGQIYHWPSGTKRNQVVNTTQTLRDPATGRPLSKQIRPGLSSVRDNPDAASDYLTPVLQFASENVPKEQHKKTPVYVWGTAGLRSLTMSERASILEDVMRDLKQEFDFEEILAEVISGSEEGFFQWLSINRLARRMGNPFNQAQGLDFHFQKPPRRRYGLVEMGGVSAQVAFEVTPAMDQFISQHLWLAPEALNAFKKLRLNISLPGENEQQPEETISVFSVSFLGFGSDKARALASDLLVRDAMARLNRFAGGLIPLIYQPNSTLIVDDPCLPRNAEYSTLKPASLLYNPSRTIGYTARPSDQAILVKYVGQGNFGQCRTLINRLILTAMREKTTCMQLDSHGICDSPLIGTYFIPWRHLQFLAIGDLFYTTDYLDMSGHFNGVRLFQRTAKLCAKTLEQINELHTADDEFSRTRNMMACFKATWIMSWLSTVLRMPIDGSVDVITTNKVMQEDVDWKLGAVIAKTVGYTQSVASR